MNEKFDELARNMAQSVTRRGALKKFGVGLAGIAVALLVPVNNAEAKYPHGRCNCKKAYFGCDPADLACLQYCSGACAP